jgi:predicted dehydrogenase
MTTPSSRHTFLKTSAALAGTALLTDSARARDLARGDDELRIALVGCGGRGTGAASQALHTDGKVKLVAMADAFADNLEESLANLRASAGDRVDVPPERRFAGFDAYERAMDSRVDVVILATPPGFRPLHFEAAVERGLHVFMEKPVAVDAAGVRQVLAAAREAQARNLKVGVGLQRRHEEPYRETVKRIQDGAIGELVLLRCYWNSGGVWVRERQPGTSEMTYQMRNWYYFNWLCGDHIVEQHIHNLDVCNWIMQGTPVEAQGVGGRQVRTGPDTGEIYDHHMVEFTYSNGVKMLSECRHVPQTWSSVSEHAHGSKGIANVSGARLEGAFGKWRFDGDSPDPDQVEHDALFAAIRADRPYGEAENGARSTMTAILGRMATYSGQVLRWDDALASTIAPRPSAYAWDGTPPTVPDADGRYPIPMPGRTQVL